MDVFAPKNRWVLAVLAIVIIIGAFFVFGGQKSEHDTDRNEANTEVEAKTDSKGVPTVQTPQVRSQAQPSAPTVATLSAASLTGSTFRLSAYNGYVLPASTQYLLSFKAGTPPFEDGFMHVKFCNDVTVRYKLRGSGLQGSPTGTKAYCDTPEGVMELENAFGMLVGSGARITLQGTALTLTDDLKTMVFIRQ